MRAQAFGGVPLAPLQRVMEACPYCAAAFVRLHRTQLTCGKLGCRDKAKAANRQRAKEKAKIRKNPMAT